VELFVVGIVELVVVGCVHAGASWAIVIEGLALERPLCRHIDLPSGVSVRYDHGRDRPELLGSSRRCGPAAEESLLTLAYYGVKTYSDSFDLVHRREASKPNAIWQADHAQLDILLIREDGTSARPWLTIVIAFFASHLSRLEARHLAQGRSTLAYLRHTGGALHR